MVERAPKEKVVLVLGATSCVAKAVLRHEYYLEKTLILVARNNLELEKLGLDLRARGAQRVHLISAELADVSKHESVYKEICTLFDELSQCLVFYGALPEQKECESDVLKGVDSIAVNFTSLVSWLQRISNTMVAQGEGLIVAISSVAGDRGRQSNYYYGAAKGGLSLYLQGLRNRLQPEDVHVLTVKPGFIDTPMTDRFEKNGLLWAAPEKVAADIVRAVRLRKDILYTPWFWRYIMFLIKCIPERLFKSLRF